MRRWAGVRAVAIFLLLSGCAGPGDGDGPGGDVPVAGDPYAGLPSLPCAADDVPGLSSSLEVLAEEGFAADPMYREELDSIEREGRILLAVARVDLGGFDLLDVTDPRAFAPVATWDSATSTFADDLKFTPDGTGIVVGGGRILEIVDVRDPAAPEHELSFELAGTGAHMIATWTLDGQDYVSISKAEGGDLSIFALEGEPGSRTLRRVSHVAATPLGELESGRPDPVRSHDSWFDLDPEAGPLLWVANVYWGVVAYDVSDPAAPVEVLNIVNPGPFAGYMHNVQVTHLGGRRLVVGVQEYGTGTLKVWDATDLANPVYIGFHASDVPTTAFHNLQVVGRFAYAGHFDEGLYVFDVSEIPTGPAPMPIRPFAHAPAPGSRLERVPVGQVQGNFATQDVEIRNGILWTSEAGFGVRSFAFGCLAYGDANATSTG